MGWQIRYAVDVPLGSDAVMHIADTAFSRNYEPSDEAADWLKDQAVNWYYEPILNYTVDGKRYWEGMRFFLPTENLQLMFKLAWGGR
jgi:hypothetical protein